MNKLFQTITACNDHAVTNVGVTIPSLKPSKEYSKLVIRDFNLQMSIGVYEEEKKTPQCVSLYLEVTLKTKPNTQNDDIQDVLSYEDIVNGIRALVQDRHYHLVERFTEDVSKFVLGFQDVKNCLVRAEKTEIFDQISGVGIEIFRTK